MRKDDKYFWGIIKFTGSAILSVMFIKLALYVGGLLCTLI